MSMVEAVILGIIQGLTEFLPVSSSGHLEIAKALFGGHMLPQDSLTMTVVLHFATALSTLVVFRKDVMEIVCGLFRFKNNKEFVFTLKIIISMIPAVIVGVFFEEQLESFFKDSVLLVGCMLLVTAALLFLADRAKKSEKEVSYLNALVIGLSQAIAMLPGISRSGATISTSVILGIDRERAARFSFLMVVPLILGKIAKDVIGGDLGVNSTQVGALGIGFIAAFISGVFACRCMIVLVKKSKLSYFALYCIVVGLMAIGFEYLR